MKLNQREIILLGFLAITILVGAFYQFAFFPQMNHIAVLEEQRAALEKTREDILSYTDPQGDMKQKAMAQQEQIGELSGKYFPELIQERIIRILEDMIIRADVDGKGLSFTPIAPGTILERLTPLPERSIPLADLAQQWHSGNDHGSGSASPPLTEVGQVYEMEVTIDFRGTYGQTMALINEIENYQRKIFISKLNLDASEGALKGTMKLHFYGIPKLMVQDQQYLNWDIFDVYGRGNPFL